MNADILAGKYHRIKGIPPDRAEIAVQPVGVAVISITRR